MVEYFTEIVEFPRWLMFACSFVSGALLALILLWEQKRQAFKLSEKENFSNRILYVKKGKALLVIDSDDYIEKKAKAEAYDQIIEERIRTFMGPSYLSDPLEEDSDERRS